jgi:hypothetical protein
MITIVDYHVRTSSKDGKEFISLELQGDFELVQSQETGRYYATAKRCSISSTFTEEATKQLIGAKYPGSRDRVKEDSSSLYLGMSSMGGSTLFSLIKTFGSLTVQWKLTSPVFGVHSLEWQFPEFLDQEKMVERMLNVK